MIIFSSFQIRSLELKHSDSVRELSKQLEQDREHWSSVNVALEARIKSLEAEELKLRTENVQLVERNELLEVEQVAQQKQLTELLETNIRLNTDICELEEQQNSSEFTRTDRENEEIMELMEKITRLQMENTDLRDRNDELGAELDGLVGELSVLRKRTSMAGISQMGGGGGGEGDEQQVNLSSSAALLGTSPTSGGIAGQATKRRGDSPSKSKIAEESPRLGKLRKRSTDEGGDELEVCVPLNAELEVIGGSGSGCRTLTEESALVSDLKARVAELERMLQEMGGKGGEMEEGSGKCGDCQEMESTLDLMRKEFESLEDYWQGKLNEERVLFEEEQRVNDEKFNDLLQKMLEYEEQFSTTMKKDERDSGRLSPIEEKDILEQQYMDLEEELNGLKRILREKNEQIKSMRSSTSVGVEGKNRVQVLPSIVAAADPSFNVAIDQTSPPESPASSPINYLWSQSTIQAPARDYQNPNWQKQKKQEEKKELLEMALDVEEAPIVVSPIQKPKPGSLVKLENGGGVENCDRESVASSNDRHSTATYNVGTKGKAGEEEEEEGESQVMPESESATKDVIDAVDEEELNQQQILLRQLQEDCKELVHRRDALLNELQQLSDLRPTMEKNFAVSRGRRGEGERGDFGYLLFFCFISIANDSSQFDLEDTAVGAEESAVAGGVEAAAGLFRDDYAQ